MLNVYKKDMTYFNCLQMAKILHDKKMKIPEISEEFDIWYGVMLYFYEASRKNKLGCRNYYWGVDRHIYGYIVIVNDKSIREFSKKYNKLLNISRSQPKYKASIKEIDKAIKETPIQKLIEKDNGYYKINNWLQCKYKRNRQRELKHIYIKGKDFFYGIWSDLLYSIIETMEYIKELQSTIENLIKQSESEKKQYGKVA